MTAYTEAWNMFSKWISIFNLLLIITFGLTSCGLKVGEPVPKLEVVELKNTKCLNQSISTLKLFFDGTATDREVDNSFKCISQVLMAFKNNVNGANRDFFAPEELAYFIETNFLKGEYEFKSEFLAEIMHLKLVLIGGSKSVFYKKDIEQFSLMIDRLRPEIVKLNFEMKIVSGKWDYSDLTDTEKEEKFLAAKKNSARFFQILSSEFSKSGQKYETDHFLNLIKELATFSKSEDKTIQKIEKARPFLISFKKNLVGEGTEIQSGEWFKISKSMHEMLFQMLRINYFLKPLAADQKEQRWVVYEKITADIFDLISSLLDAQKKPVLSNQQVYDLISSLLPIFTDQTIDHDLVQSFSDIKVALIGKNITSADRWTASDLILIKNKLPVLFSEFQKISRIFKDMNLQNIVWAQSYSDFNKFETEFNSSVINLVQIFDGEYSFSSLKLLFTSLQNNKLLPGFDLPENFDQLLNFAVSVKYVMTGNKGSEMTNADFKQVIQAGSATFFHYLEYKNYIKIYTQNDDAFYLALQNILPKVKNTLQNILKFKPSHIIVDVEIQNLFQTLKHEDLFHSDIGSTGLQAVLNVLWSNILVQPEHRLQGLVLPGFNSEALDVLSTELDIYIQSNHDVFAIFKSDVLLGQSEIAQRIDQIVKAGVSPIQLNSLSELIRVVSSPVTMALDTNKFLKIFDGNMYALTDLQEIQFSRTLARVMVRTLSKDEENLKLLNGITLPEAEFFFEAIKPLIFELDLISPTNTTFISSRFREANLFVAHANGDQLANYEELTDLMMHIFSGLKRAKALQNGAIRVCLPPQNDPVTSETTVYEDCLLKYYFDTSVGFESMPEFFNMKKQFSEDQNKKYYLSLLKAAGHVPNAKQVVYFADANLFPHVVQYLEILFAKYDKDRDGLLTKDEAMLAYPVFKSTIKEMLKVIPNGSKITDAQLPGVFIYLLKYGRPPKGLGETLKFLGFINDEKQWIIQSNRLDLGIIFNFIADSLAKP